MDLRHAIRTAIHFSIGGPAILDVELGTWIPNADLDPLLPCLLGSPGLICDTD